MPIDTRQVERDATLNAKYPAKKGGPLIRRIGREAYYKILREEGPEVLEPGGDSYWRDQEKRFPHLKCGRSEERRVFNGYGAGKRGDATPGRMRFREGHWERKTGLGRWANAK